MIKLMLAKFLTLIALLISVKRIYTYLSVYPQIFDKKLNEQLTKHMHTYGTTI